MADTEEIFSSESESLYYKVRALRDEIERSDDEENDEVLFDLLSTTMDMVDMKATSEYKDKVREIVVRKDDENVSTVMLHEKLFVGETIGGIVLLVGGIIAAAVSLFGTGKFAFSIKAIIFVLLGVGAFIGCQFAKKMSIAKIQAAYKALEGKTIVGMKLKKRDFNADDSSAVYKQIAGNGKKKTIIAAVTAVIVLVMLGIGGFVVYSKVIAPSQTYENAEAKFLSKDYSGALALYNELSEDYKDTQKKKEALGYINMSEPDYMKAIDAVSMFGQAYNELRDELTAEKNEYFYNKGSEAYIAKDFDKAAKCFEKVTGYLDADTKKENSIALNHYYAAQKMAEKSLYDALVELRNVTNGIQDTNELIAYYEKLVPVTGKYVNDDIVMNITGYNKKKNVYYVRDSAKGDIRIEDSDKEEYLYKAVLAEKSWYVNKEQILYVYPETYDEKGTEKTRTVEKILKKQ